MEKGSWTTSLGPLTSLTVLGILFFLLVSVLYWLKHASEGVDLNSEISYS